MQVTVHHFISPNLLQSIKHEVHHDVFFSFPYHVATICLSGSNTSPAPCSHNLYYIRSGLKQTDSTWTSVCSFVVLLLHQSSLELMKIKKEQILFHFLFIMPDQTQWTHRWYHLCLHHRQLRHNELKMAAPNVRNPVEVAWNSLSQTVTIPKQQQWIYYSWGNRTLNSQKNLVVAHPITTKNVRYIQYNLVTTFTFHYQLMHLLIKNTSTAHI